MEQKKKIVIKVGTSTLTGGSNRISYATIENLARQILSIRDRYNVILVSSGAIATARQFAEIHQTGTAQIESKQALAAIGQPKLIRIFDEVFGSLGLQVAQCLLTYRDFDNDTARENVRNTLHKLLDFGYIPIINENDTVAVDEIIFGDNDKLSAYVAIISEADLLMLVTDIDGIYTQNPHLHPEAELIEDVTDTEAVKAFIQERDNGLGTGGMTSKIYAAELCLRHGLEMRIVNGNQPSFIVGALEGRFLHTRFKG
jgi:glutamate 5-kinase